MGKEASDGEQMDYQEVLNASDSTAKNCSSRKAPVFYSGYDDWQDPSRDYARARRPKAVHFGRPFENCGNGSSTSKQPSLSPPNTVVITAWRKRAAPKRDASGNIIVCQDDWGLPNSSADNKDIRGTKCARN